MRIYDNNSFRNGIIFFLLERIPMSNIDKNILSDKPEVKEILEKIADV